MRIYYCFVMGVLFAVTALTLAPSVATKLKIWQFLLEIKLTAQYAFDVAIASKKFKT